jgi:hypothetical protein
MLTNANMVTYVFVFGLFNFREISLFLLKNAFGCLLPKYCVFAIEVLSKKADDFMVLACFELVVYNFSSW